MENWRGILSFLKKKKKRAKEEEISQSFIENGGLLLEELIKTSNGRYRFPIRNFSAKDILKATNNFDWHNGIHKDNNYIMYKGSLEGRLIVVKKYTKFGTELVRDIAITVQMCIHKNVLKLVGCCLEDESPAIVYEHVEGRFLDVCIEDGVGHGNRPLSWKCRLRAANEIASAVAYLHTALDRPVVHRGIIPDNFIIDQHGVIKLCDFSLSISIPLGESRVEDNTLRGTLVFADPEYLISGFVSVKSDVFGFGALLFLLLTGKSVRGLIHMNKVSDSDQINEIVDPKILRNGGGRGGTDQQELQFRAFAALALRCIQERGDDRPDMIEVAKELRRIERSIPLQLPPP